MALARGISASQAKEYYYEKDPMFNDCKESTSGQDNTSWFGRGKDSLGLTYNENIKSEKFNAVIQGVNPQNGEPFIQMGVNGEHRAGVDLAFSPPKSVSIMALHAGDDRLVDAHKDAVKETMSWIEDNFVNARITKNGVTKPVQTNNMVAALFTHATSRENDPQLHTHSIVLNATQTENGWRAIDNTSIFMHQKVMLAHYQSGLADKVKDLGFTINNYSNKWEIGGVSKDVIDNFSKRSHQIEETIKELKEKYPNASDIEISEKAVLASRQSKDPNLTADDLKNRWESEFSKEDILKSVKEYSKPEKEMRTPEEYINMAYKSIHEKESTFTLAKLQENVLHLSKGIHSPEQMLKSIDESMKSGDILTIGTASRWNYEYSVLSTPEMLNIERETAENIINSKDTMDPLLSEEIIDKHLEDSGLMKGQEELVKRILTTGNAVTVVQGDAGTGKTHATNYVKEILEKTGSDVEMVGLGFTGKAAKELSDKMGIDTQTIHSYLLQKDKPESEAKEKLIFVDEASMVGSKQLFELVDGAMKEKARLILIGDGKQLQAIGAGKLFKDLQEKNMVDEVRLDEVVRQKNDFMKDLVTDIKDFMEKPDSENSINKAFESLKENDKISNHPLDQYTPEINREGLHYQAALAYLEKESELKEFDKDVLLITPGNRDREILNNIIRSEKLANGELSNDSTIVGTLESVSMTDLDKKLATQYVEGQTVFLTKDIEGIESGDSGKILSIDRENNKIEIDIDGENHTIDTFQNGEHLAVYQEKEKDFTEGDKILFTKNDKELDVQNGTTGTIENIDEDGKITVDIGDGKSVEFDSDTYSYLDHAYAVTVHKSQGQTADTTILFAKTTDDALSQNSTEMFYVAATRAEEDFQVFTPNSDTLEEMVKGSQEKTSTLDYVVIGSEIESPEQDQPAPEIEEISKIRDVEMDM